MSTLHQEQLQSDRQRVHPGNPGKLAHGPTYKSLSYTRRITSPKWWSFSFIYCLLPQGVSRVASAETESKTSNWEMEVLCVDLPECSVVFQRTTYVWQQPLRCFGGESLPPPVVSACVSLDFWLRFGVSTGTIAAVLLISISCYFWKKTRK